MDQRPGLSPELRRVVLGLIFIVLTVLAVLLIV